MITWFDEPYTVRLPDGFDYLMQGVFLAQTKILTSFAILIDSDGKYLEKPLTEVQTDWRRRKDGTWGGSNLEQD